MGKGNRCSELNLNDPGSIFFWGLITILFILVIGNFILTLSLISFFKIGMGMESIELVPEMKTIKFFGITDFLKVFKKDGLIDGFNDVPMKIESDEGSLKFNLIDRKGHVHNRLTVNSEGIEIKDTNIMYIRDPETNHPIFTTSSKQKYSFERSTKNLESTIIHAANVASPVDKKLQLQSMNLFVRGVEGTVVDGKEILFSAEQNIFLKSSNGSIELNAANGIYIDTERISNPTKDGLILRNNGYEYKLCVCFPKGSLYKAPLVGLDGSLITDPCKMFDRHVYNPCI